MRGRWLFGTAFCLASSLVFADSSLLLNDGQVIKGTDIRRDGESYLVTMAGGNVVAFPAALVKQVNLVDDGPPKAPPTWDYSGPKQLAGPGAPVNQDPNDQLKVLGPPTRWSKDAVDTTWVPTNAYDPNADVMANSRSKWSKDAVDTSWVPTNAYDMDKDVMAKSKSTWSKDAVDTTWKPQDGFGFKPLAYKGTGPPPTPEQEVAALTAPAPYTRPSGPSPWGCAEAIFAKDADKPADPANRAPSLDVKPVKTPLYASLGLPLYEANSEIAGKPQKAIFTITGGQCRLLGGDSDAILGLNLAPEHAMAQGNASFSAALAARGGGPVVPGGVDKLEYAYALVSLTDPQVSGAGGATLKLITKPDELKKLAAGTPTSCTLPKGKRRKEEQKATSAFVTPKISAGKEGDVVTFLTWSGASGTLYANTVVLARGGVVSASRGVVASHFGPHKD